MTLTVEVEYAVFVVVEGGDGDEDFPNQNRKPRNQLQRDYLRLLETSKDSDLTFLIADEKIEAHKNILSVRSTYFANMLESGMEENLSDQVRVTDAEPRVFRAMLEFLYAGIWPPSEMALDALVLADKYGVDDLRRCCLTILYVNLVNGKIFRSKGVDGVVEVLHLAERLEDEELHNRARIFLRRNLHEFVGENRQKLLQNYPEVLFRAFDMQMLD